MFPIMGATNPTGYNLTRSLRFRSSASAYLKRTLTGVSITKLSYSVWTKRGALGSDYTIQGSLNNASNYFYLGFNSSDQLDFLIGGTANRRKTTQVFRDPSAWYHIYLVLDTTQATADNRIKIYVNGAQVTAFATNTTGVAQNANLPALSTTMEHDIGGYNAATAGWFYDGYFADYYYLEGQALDVTSFGSTNATTGVWQPIRYAGTFTGTNSCYLPFTDNSALTTSSNAGLGKDFSGNGNYWTTNNISITSGTTYDSMTDVPTLTSATAANFCVLNPINKSPSSTVSNGNLRQTSSGGWYRAYSTIFFASTAAFYAEATMTALNSGSNGVRVGVANANSVFTYLGSDANSWSYDNQGNKYNNGSLSAYGASYVQGDVIGILLNNGSLTFYKNGVSQGVAYSGLTGTFCFAGSPFDTDTVDWNFGQRPFAYSLPSGALALNTFNLPDSTIVKGNTVMDATLYTGNGGTNTIVNAAGFRPDFAWQKARGQGYAHGLYDSVRGVTKKLSTNSTDPESTVSGLTAFNSNGITLGSDAGENLNASSFVSWQWQAGQGSTSSNTNGTITSTVSVNASAGFSVVTYTGTGANATVGHGLGVVPSMAIFKSRTGTGWLWAVYHISTGNTGYMRLDDSGVFVSSGITFQNTTPTSSVFSIGSAGHVNNSGGSIVAYCFAPIAGYSAFGSYTGNGSTDGPFVYTGFLPRWVMVKRTDASGTNWDLYDTARNPYNAMDLELFPNSGSAEYNGGRYFDFLSNGFKPRTTVTDSNASGGTYIYAAFATNPFKNALAR